jgi:hypothetical protein
MKKEKVESKKEKGESKKVHCVVSMCPLSGIFVTSEETLTLHPNL